MDSRAVSVQIKQRIWPLLKESAFDAFSSRTAWRHKPDSIDVVNFQSFNSYLADSLKCTTFSFAVNLGCYFMAIPSRFGDGRIKVKNGLVMPQEYECHIRGGVKPTIQQPDLRADGIWFIDDAGTNLSSQMTDVLQSLQREAIPWFEQFSSAANVLHILLHEPETMGRLFGFGRNPSPLRHYLVGYIALRIGDRECAKEHLEKALGSGCFSWVHERLVHDVAAATAAPK